MEEPHASKRIGGLAANPKTISGPKDVVQRRNRLQKTSVPAGEGEGSSVVFLVGFKNCLEGAATSLQAAAQHLGNNLRPRCMAWESHTPTNTSVVWRRMRTGFLGQRVLYSIAPQQITENTVSGEG